MSEKFALIGAEKADPTSAFTVTLMCGLLEVSSSGFYDWCAAPCSDRARRRATIATHVQAAFTAGRGSYGVRRVRQVLARSKDPQIASVSLKMVRSVMQELDLHACQPRAYKVTTVRDANAAPTITDHLRRDFTAATPGAKLVGDITYVATWQGWLYMATVIDCHSKAVIGWAIAHSSERDPETSTREPERRAAAAAERSSGADEDNPPRPGPPPEPPTPPRSTASAPPGHTPRSTPDTPQRSHAQRATPTSHLPEHIAPEKDTSRSDASRTTGTYDPTDGNTTNTTHNDQ